MPTGFVCDHMEVLGELDHEVDGGACDEILERQPLPKWLSAKEPLRSDQRSERLIAVIKRWDVRAGRGNLAYSGFPVTQGLSYT